MSDRPLAALTLACAILPPDLWHWGASASRWRIALTLGPLFVMVYFRRTPLPPTSVTLYR